MDICVQQLTCGQGQHAGSVQHEEHQADIQDDFHFPPVGFISVLIPRPRVVVMSPFLSRSWIEITHSVERAKTARVQKAERSGFY